MLKVKWVHYKRKNNCPPKSTPTRVTGHHQNIDGASEQLGNLAYGGSGIPTTPYLASGS